MALLRVLFVIAALCASFANCFSVFKRAEKLKVLAPNRADKFGIGVDIEIRWEFTDEKEVKIEMRKGLPENLTTVHVVSPNTPNNGSYLWRSRDDSFLRSTTPKLPTAPPSGCDYVITVRDSKNTVASEYFSITHPRDDGIPANTRCPTDAPTIKEGPAGKPNAPGSDGAEGGQSSNNNNAVTAAMLGGAVGGVAGGLIIGMAIMVFIGRSRGWFVSDNHIQGLIANHPDVRRCMEIGIDSKPLSPAQIYHQMPAGADER